MNNLDFARVAMTARLREQSDTNVRDDVADLARLQAAADQHLRDNLPLPESCCARDARIDSGEEDGPSDEDIIEFGKEWELGLVELVECLEAFTARARAAGLVMA